MPLGADGEVRCPLPSFLRLFPSSRLAGEKLSLHKARCPSQRRPVSYTTVLCNGQSPCLSLERNKNDEFRNVGTLVKAVIPLSPNHSSPWKTELHKRLFQGKYRWKGVTGQNKKLKASCGQVRGRMCPSLLRPGAPLLPCARAAPSLNFLWVFLCI